MADFYLSDFLTRHHHDCKPRDFLRGVQRCAQIEPYGRAMRTLTKRWYPDNDFHKQIKRAIFNPPPKGEIVSNPNVTHWRKKLQEFIRTNYPSSLLDPQED